MGYGACIQRNIDALDKGACEKEFAALRKCFAKAVKLTEIWSNAVYFCARTHIIFIFI